MATANGVPFVASGTALAQTLAGCAFCAEVARRRKSSEEKASIFWVSSASVRHDLEPQLCFSTAMTLPVEIEFARRLFFTLMPVSLSTSRLIASTCERHSSSSGNAAYISNTLATR